LAFTVTSVHTEEVLVSGQWVLVRDWGAGLGTLVHAAAMRSTGSLAACHCDLTGVGAREHRHKSASDAGLVTGVIAGSQAVCGDGGHQAGGN